MSGPTVVPASSLFGRAVVQQSGAEKMEWNESTKQAVLLYSIPPPVELGQNEEVDAEASPIRG